MDIVLKFLHQHIGGNVLALLLLLFPSRFPASAVLAPQTGTGSTAPHVEIKTGKDGTRRAVFTLLTYNIKNCQNGGAIPEIAAEIAATGAQVVFLQEVDCGTTRSGGTDQARLLAEALGFTYAYFPAMEFNGGYYGTAILSAFPLQSAAVTPLPPVPTLEPRAIGQADIEIEGQPIRLFVTHLSYESGAARAIQFAQLRKALCAAPERSYLLGGDFNISFRSEYCRLPARPAHNMLSRDKTLSRIDNLYCDKGKCLSNVRSVPTGYSDHDLLLADVSIPLPASNN